MIFVAVIADHDEAAYAAVREQGFIDCEIGEILFDSQSLIGIERYAGLDGVQRRRRIAGIVGERVWRQAWWKVVTHPTTVADDQ